jgi:hypothetical protein
VKWGAQKAGFKCSDENCNGEELKLLESTVFTETVDKLKLKGVKPKKRLPVPDEDDFDEYDDPINEHLDNKPEDIELNVGEIEIEEVVTEAEDFNAPEEIEGVIDVDIIDEPLDLPLGGFDSIPLGRITIIEP